MPFVEHLTGAGVDTLLVTTTPTDAARPATGDGGAALRTTSLTEGLADVKATIKEASLARQWSRSIRTPWSSSRLRSSTCSAAEQSYACPGSDAPASLAAVRPAGPPTPSEAM